MRTEQLSEAVTLYCGDCREVVPSLGTLDCVVSDPPYGMAFKSSYRKGSSAHKAIAGDGDAALLQWACKLPVRHSRYLFCRWDNLLDVPKPKSLVTWVKPNWSMGDLKHEHGRQTEVALFYPGADHCFPHGRPPDVVQAALTGNDLHPTQKPVPLMMQVIDWTVGTVCDPFMGSGTTGVACVNLERPFIGCEVDPGYFDIACKRLDEALRAERRMFGMVKRVAKPAADTQAALFS